MNFSHHLSSLKEIERLLLDTVGPFSVEANGAASPRLDVSVREIGKNSIIYTKLNSIRLKRNSDALMERWEGQAFIGYQRYGLVCAEEDGRPYSSSKGGLVLIDPAKESSLWVDNEACFLSLAVSRDCFLAMEKCSPSIFGIPVNGECGLGRIASSIFGELISPDNFFSEREMRYCVSSLVDILGNAIYEQNNKSASPDTLLLEKMTSWAIDHIGDPILSPSTLAEEFKFSRRGLYRFFEENGLKPDAWLWELRVQEAGKRLRAPASLAITITDVAFGTGFNDSSHFIRLFRKAFGVTPNRYRKRYQT